MKRTLIIFALVAAMMLQILPVAAFAQEAAETEPAAVETIPEVTEAEIPQEVTEPSEAATEPAPEETEPVTVETAPEASGDAEASEILGTVDVDPAYNPLYSNAGTAAPRAQSFSVEDKAVTASATYTRDQAAALLRSKMESRVNYISMDISFSSVPTGNDLVAIWNQALAETGVPTQGDYLYWVWQYREIDGQYYKSGSKYICQTYFYVEYYTTASQEAALTKEVNAIIDSFGFTPATTDYEKTHTIYKWLCDNITYDYTSSGMGKHTAYNGIMYRTCVCQGYASLMYRMLLQVGVPVRMIGGDAYDVYPYAEPYDPDGGDNHVWNIVKIAGKWYNLDATWDAGYAPSNWNWFLLSSSNFNTSKKEHNRWSDYTTSSFYNTYPVASSNFSPSVYNGIMQVNGYWGYYKNGFLQTSYTGLVSYNGSQFYVQNGILDMNYTGLSCIGDTWYYIQNGAWTKTTDLCYYNDTWFYVVNGIIDWTYTGLVPYNGNYFYVQNNVLDWSYTSLGYHAGNWYFIQNGLLQLDYTGLVYFNDNWFYVENGLLTYEYFGMVEYQGNYFYVQASHLDWSYTGLGYHEGGWYFIQNALMQRNYTGFVEFNGEWFYVEQGVLTFQYTSLVYYNGNYFYVENSRIRWDYTGWLELRGQTYYIENGVMRWY